MKKIALFGALLAATLLSACEGSNKALPVACPSVRLLPGADTIVRFTGAGIDITDVEMEVEFTASRGQCEIGDEEVTVSLLVQITAQRGPASNATVGEFDYFVAVVDKDDTVLQRRSIAAAVDFSGNRSRVPYGERLLINIPKEESKNAGDFTIFMGLELTKDELDFNRRRRAQS